MSNEHLTDLLSSSALIVVGVAAASVGRLIERIVIAQKFSPAMYGEVTIGFSIMTIGTTISLVGLNEGLPRFISRFNDEKDVRGVWCFGLVISILVSFVVSCILLLNLDYITNTLFETGKSGKLLRLFILTIPINVGLIVGVSLLRGMENTRYKLYTKDLLYPGARILLLVMLVMSGFNLLAVGYAYLVATLGTFVIVFLVSNRLVPLVGPIQTHSRELLTYSAPLIITMVLSILLTQMDTLMVAHFRTSNEVGVYNAAYPLANSLLMVISSFGYLYLPLTSRLDSEGEREEVTNIYQLTTKWIYVFTFPAFLVFTLFPSEVITLFFSPQYADGGKALAILSIGFFTSAAAGRNQSTLAALGHTTAILGADILTLSLNFVLNLFLIPQYGFVGAAVASAAAYVIRNVAFNVMLWSKCGISPFSKHTMTTYVALPLVLFPVGVIASTWVSITVFTLPLFLVLLGLLGLLVVAVAGGFQPDDSALFEFVEQITGIKIPLVQRYI